jgi:hypothetical protein
MQAQAEFNKKGDIRKTVGIWLKISEDIFSFSWL